jgi:glycosyltransferase involved in cell wall biosynthesis
MQKKLSQTIPVTAVILSFNEEKRIEKCVASLETFEKVILLDSFSTDETVNKAFRAWKIIGRNENEFCLLEREWKGFTEARNFSLTWVTTPWVFWIDSDEWIERDLRHSLRTIKFQDLRADVFRVARQSYFLGKKIRFGGWYPDRKARLARTSNCHWRKGPRGADVHEDLFSKNEKNIERPIIDGHIGHEPFLNRKEQRDTNQRYSTLLAEGLALQYQKKEKEITKQEPNFYSLRDTTICTSQIEAVLSQRGWLCLGTTPEWHLDGSAQRQMQNCALSRQFQCGSCLIQHHFLKQLRL